MITALSQLRVLGNVVLVCGGRRFEDKILLGKELGILHRKHDFSLLVHGAARGADSLAERWARSNDIPYIGVPAPWEELGNGAGPTRNRAMPALVKIDFVVAFPGGSGTRNMIRVANRHKIPVITPGWKP